jgi:hypothetical protein
MPWQLVAVWKQVFCDAEYSVAVEPAAPSFTFLGRCSLLPDVPVSPYWAFAFRVGLKSLLILNKTTRYGIENNLFIIHNTP